MAFWVFQERRGNSRVALAGPGAALGVILGVLGKKKILLQKKKILLREKSINWGKQGPFTEEKDPSAEKKNPLVSNRVFLFRQEI